MRGGFIIGLDPGLYARAAEQIVSIGGSEDGSGDDRVVQFADASGRLFTMYAPLAPGTVWDVHKAPFSVAEGVDPPDMPAMTACLFECRWPDLVVEVARTIALASDVPTWLLDGDGVVWDARQVDPSAVTL